MKKMTGSIAAACLILLLGWGCATPTGKAPKPSRHAAASPLKTAGVDAHKESIASEAENILAQITLADGKSGHSSPFPSTDEAAHLTEILPDHPYPWLMLGLAALDEGKDAMSGRAFNRALELDPDSSTALLGMGDLARKAGDEAVAEKYYSRAFESTGDVQSAQRLSWLRIKNGRPDNAIPVLQSVFEEGTSNGTVRNNLAVALDLTGLSSDALEILGTEEYRDPILFDTRATIELRGGRPDLAEADLERLLDKGAGGPESILLLGILNLQKGNLPAAEENFRKFIELTPQSPDGYLNLGLTLRRRGSFRDAEMVYMEGISATGDPDLHLNLGVLYELYLGSPQKALEHYRKFSEAGGGGTEQVQGWIDYLAGLVDSGHEKEKPAE